MRDVTLMASENSRNAAERHWKALDDMLMRTLSAGDVPCIRDGIRESLDSVYRTHLCTLPPLPELNAVHTALKAALESAWQSHVESR